jgi:hypothetical protein
VVSATGFPPLPSSRVLACSSAADSARQSFGTANLNASKYSSLSAARLPQTVASSSQDGLFLICSDRAANMRRLWRPKDTPMSIEIHVLFAGELPSKSALAKCFDELGFPLAFHSDIDPLEGHKGFLPMLLRGVKSGVEFDIWNDRETVEDIAGDDVDPQFTRTANFRFGGDEKELAVALCFAAGLAKSVNGAVFDAEEGELQTVEEAIDIARRQVATPAR